MTPDETKMLAQFDADVKAAKEAVIGAQKAMADVKARRLAWLAERAGVKIGDVVIIGGYSHKGKHGIVTGFRETYSKYFSVRGDVLNQDGKPGLNSFDTDAWTLVSKE